MITQTTYVEGLGKYATSTGDLAANVKELRGRLASMRDNAFARLKTSGINVVNIGKTEGTRVALEFDYIRGANPVVVKYDKLSPVLAKKTVEANRQDQYLCTNSTRRYDVNARTAEREDKSGIPFKDRTALLLSRDNFNMSPTENANCFAFFLEDLASENSYFVLNGKVPITVYPIDKTIVDGKCNTQLLQNPNGTIVVPYGWFRSLGNRSGLDGYDRYAYICDDTARGMYEASD
jgi:hypothetical protein